MKFKLLSALALSSQLGFIVHAHPTGELTQLTARQTTCTKTEDCGSSPSCTGGRVSFICEEGECVCKAPDAPPTPPTCNNDDECNGARLCATDEGYQPFCNSGTCSCRIPPPPVPYHTLKLSETQISFGTGVNEDEGRGMKKALADALLEHCPEGDDHCSKDSFDLGRISLILNEGREYMNLQGTIDRSHYSSKESRDFMISLVALGAIDATRGSCARAPYKEPVEGGTGCPDPDHTGLSYKRDLSAFPVKNPSSEDYDDEIGESRLRARISDGQPTRPERTCNYVTNMCAGPKTLYTVNGRDSDPYMDDMLIRFELVSPPNGMSDVAKWACSAGLGLLTDLAGGKLPGHASDILGIAGIPDDQIDIICGEDTGPDPEEFDVE